MGYFTGYIPYGMLCLPAALGDDHFGAELMELLPQILALQGNLGIIDDTIVLGL